MNYYLFNIGKPSEKKYEYFNRWWHRHISQGFITAGYSEKLYLGEKKLKDMKAGDWVIAYVNGYGVVGAGSVGKPYFFLEELPPDYETNHQHHLPVLWHYFVDNVSEAVPAKELNLSTQRVGTKTKLNDVHAKYIISLLQERCTLYRQFYPEEVSYDGALKEGTIKTVSVDNRERNPEAR